MACAWSSARAACGKVRRPHSGNWAVLISRSSAALRRSKRLGSRRSKMSTSTISTRSRCGSFACAASGRCSSPWTAAARASMKTSILQPGPGALRRSSDWACARIARTHNKEETMKSLTRVIALLSFACAAAAHAQNISIATGGTGGVYYPLGGGMAAVLSKYVPGIQATAEVTGGSVANLQLIGTGKPYLGMTMADAGLDALKGQDKFTGKPVPIRTLMIMYPNRMHVVTIEGTGVNAMKDLKGKRVSTGSGGSATEVMAFRVIEAAGLDKDRDMKRERLGVAESVNAIKDRKIDAFFWVGGLPTAAVTDLANTPGVKIKMIDHADTVAAMNKKYGPLYIEDVIPKATYRGMDADNRQATVWNILVSHENLSNQTAYNIVKTIFDKRDDMIAVHKEAENFRLENQKASASPIPFHPGAVKYFAERGVRIR